MSLDHILLGMLRKPASGYDLKREFDEGPRHFWSAELSQIYPTLNRLERQGFLGSSQESSAQGPKRRVYRRTKAGRKELLRWLRSGPKMGAQRFAYIAQLAFMHEAGGPERTREFMLHLREELSGFLAFLEAEAERYAKADARPELFSDFEFHDFLCLRMGITSIRARVDWCDECLRRINKRRRRQAKEAPAK